MADKIAVPESALYYTKGVTAYVKDGEIIRNAPSDGVLVGSSSDLELLTAFEPGTLAFTSGFEHMWMKNITTGWTQIV